MHFFFHILQAYLTSSMNDNNFFMNITKSITLINARFDTDDASFLSDSKKYIIVLIEDINNFTSTLSTNTRNNSNHKILNILLYPFLTSQVH